VRTGQIGALPEDGPRGPGGFGSIEPRIVIACGGGSLRRSAWASTSDTASLIVSATATHPQEQDIAHRAAIAPPSIALGPERGVSQ
jgi:hypothetical protein